MSVYKYNPEGSTLRRDQKKLLEMLQYVSDLCKAYNIQYWLSSGTLLGGARHKGFIPWDDDMDIVMLKKDYKKLEKILCSIDDSQFVFHCMKTDVDYIQYFGKFRKRKGKVLSKSLRYNYYKWAGIGFDIFAIEKTNYLSARIVELLYHKMQRPTQYIRIAIIRKPLIRIVETINTFFFHPILRLIGKINPKDEYHYVLGAGWAKHTFYMKDTFPLSTLDFEGIKMPCPHNTDAYLTNVYGNWHEAPTHEEILKTIHCQQYIDEIQKIDK